MLFKKCLLALGLMVCATGIFAATTEIAADVISVKTPVVDEQTLKNGSTELTLELINNGNYRHKLVAATSPIAKRVQLHEMIAENGQMDMEQIKSITIKKHQEEDLKVGGLHIMLMGLEKTLIQNQQIPITLIFNDGSWIQTYARVEKTA